MVSQAGYHAHHSDSKRPGHAYSPYMPTNRYTESRVYVPNNEHRGMMGESMDKGEGTTRKRIAVACGRCRQRKIRCSGDKGQNMPCTNCYNAGVAPCLFLRVSSRETSIKNDFDYNTNISRALAHRSPVPPLPLSSNHYGTVTSDFSPSGSSSSGGPGDPYRSTASLYPYSHKTYYNSLPPSPWTPAYNEDCSTPTDYSTPQTCGPYAVVSDQTSQLMPPYTWDGRTPAGPPPPPLTLKVQAPSSASALDSGSVPLLPLPTHFHSHPLDHGRNHSQGQGHSLPRPIQDSQYLPPPPCRCHDCTHGQGHAQNQSVPANAGTPKPQADLVPSYVPSQGQQSHPTHQAHQDHDTDQYLHGELVYRPVLHGGSDSDIVNDSSFHQDSPMHSAFAHTSTPIDDRGTKSRISSSNNGGGGSSSKDSNNRSSTSGCESTFQAVSMSRAPSHGSVANHANMPMPHFKQEIMSSRNTAPSPAPIHPVQSVQSAQSVSSSMQAHMAMPAPLPPLSLASQGHAINSMSSINAINSPYSSSHVSAANSAENLARVNYATSNDNSRRSSCHVTDSSYSKAIYESSLYMSASSVAAPVSDRTNEGSIFSDQERNVVGTQGPGPVACLESYTYDSGPSTSSNSNSTDATAKVLVPSQSSSSLHGVYGRQNKKKSSTDSLIKTRPYSPAEGPMLPQSNHHHSHGHGHAHIGSSRQPSTPVCGSPLPPPMHAHDIKADPSYESLGR